MKRLETAKWEASNRGHKPRGRGNWLFKIDGAGVLTCFGTFSWAKRDALRVCNHTAELMP
jgi:hypothetical protein